MFIQPNHVQYGGNCFKTFNILNFYLLTKIVYSLILYLTVSLQQYMLTLYIHSFYAIPNLFLFGPACTAGTDW